MAVFAAAWMCPAQAAHGQMMVVDALLQGTTVANQVTNVVHFVQTAYETYQNAMNTYEQVKRVIEAEKKALENLKKFGEVKSWSDFMEWKNRQLSLERSAENKLKSTKLKIGNDKITLANIQDLPDAVRNGAVDWVDMLGRELTEKEKMEIWRKEGISPANYMYVASVKARQKALYDRMQAGTEIENDEQEKSNEDLKNEMDKLAGLDANVDSEKEYLAIIAKSSIEQRKQLDKLNAQTAMANEAAVIEAQKQVQIQEPLPVGDYLTKKNDAYGLPEGWQEISE